MQTIYKILIVAGIAIILVIVLRKMGILHEGFVGVDGDLPETADQVDTSVQDDQKNSVDVQNTNVLNYAQPSNPYELNHTAQAGISTVTPAVNPYTPPSNCFPQDEVKPEDLLPEKSINPWTETAPDTGMQNFLESAHHFSINTVGQSLRNANLQLRSDPPISKIAVSPWWNSTITPDTNHRFLEIGGAIY